MRIAFTSCMNAQINPSQPVWDEIAAQLPDQLVLLGDSIYLDVPWAGGVHPRALSTFDFLQLGRQLYQLQFNVPGFAALVRSMPTHAVWDDHDFLWNEAYNERAVQRKIYRDTVLASRALFNAFVAVLDARGAVMPPLSGAGAISQLGALPPGYRFRDLGEGVVLHLTDGRSWRLKDELLGADQRQQMQAQIAQLPADTVHLVASGSVVMAEKGESWSDFPGDLGWLQGLAAQHRMLVLSGDIHDNRSDAIDLGNNRWLFDATASGAAVSRMVAFGEPLRSYGLVDIAAAGLTVQFFQRGAPDRPPMRIDRAAWRPL